MNEKMNEKFLPVTFVIVKDDDDNTDEYIFNNEDEAMIFACNILKRYKDFINIPVVRLKKAVVWKSAEYAIEHMEKYE